MIYIDVGGVQQVQHKQHCCRRRQQEQYWLQAESDQLELSQNLLTFCQYDCLMCSFLFGRGLGHKVPASGPQMCHAMSGHHLGHQNESHGVVHHEQYGDAHQGHEAAGGRRGGPPAKQQNVDDFQAGEDRYEDSADEQEHGPLCVVGPADSLDGNHVLYGCQKLGNGPGQKNTNEDYDDEGEAYWDEVYSGGHQGADEEGRELRP